mmetsp:Transcript_160335/g.282945  ORF Transcript_160335/g.282945 Transcript_160335/m.282945 type:complete len:103 (+) Transcript_160335:614-922(+)
MPMHINFTSGSKSFARRYIKKLSKLRSKLNCSTDCGLLANQEAYDVDRTADTTGGQHLCIRRMMRTRSRRQKLELFLTATTEVPLYRQIFWLRDLQRCPQSF